MSYEHSSGGIVLKNEELVFYGKAVRKKRSKILTIIWFLNVLIFKETPMEWTLREMEQLYRHRHILKGP